MRGYVGLTREAKYGAGGAPRHFLPVLETSPSEQAAPAEFIPWGTGGRAPLSFFRRADVRFAVEAQPDPLGHLLTALLGPPVTTQVASGVWRHVFEPRPGRPSYAIEAGDGIVANRADGVRLSTLEFSLRAGGLLAVGGEGAGRQALPAATATTSYAGEGAPTWRNATVLVSGTADPSVVETAVRITAPLRPVAAVGRTGRPAEMLPAGAARTEVRMVIQQPTSAWLSYLRNGTELSWELRVPGTLVGASSYQVTVRCPRLRLTAAPFQVTRALPMLTVQGEAYAASDALRGVRVTLVNVTAFYEPPPLRSYAATGGVAAGGVAGVIFAAIVRAAGGATAAGVATVKLGYGYGYDGYGQGGYGGDV